MKIVSKDFCTFTGVYTAIYMGPCRRSYNLRKFRIFEMLDKWNPISKLSDIKFSHYPDDRYIFFLLVREPVCPPYLLNLFFDIFKSFLIELWVLANMLTLPI